MCISIGIKAEVLIFSDDSDTGNGYQSVRFSNNENIRIQSNNNTPLNKIIINEEKENGIRSIENDRIRIFAAYPNKNTAKVALISTQCNGNGTICTYSSIYVVYLYQNRLVVSYLGEITENGYKIRIDLNEGQDIKVVGTELSFGEKDKLGDPIRTSRILIPGQGFISTNFNKKYIELLGKHPDEFLKSKALRNNVVKKMGADNFFEMRTYMSGPGSTYATDGKYLVLQACKAHECPDYMGIIVIDAETEKFWSLSINTKFESIKQFSNSKWDEKVQNIVREEIQFFQKNVKLSNGTFIYTK